MECYFLDSFIVGRTKLWHSASVKECLLVLVLMLYIRLIGRTEWTESNIKHKLE
jgi:hypothetical protein